MSSNTRTLLVTPKFRVEELAGASGGGGASRRAVVRHPGAVAMIPLLDSERVCLIRNRRVTVNETLIEIPAGTRDPGETPEQTAHRELLEETGYRAARMRPICRFFTSPGVLDEEIHVFVAEDLTAEQASPDAGEEIENLTVAWDEALAMIGDGTIRDAKTIAALLYYDRERRSR